MNEKIVVSLSGVGNQLKIDYAVANFTERCQKIVTKFQDAIRGFINLLQGKTSKAYENWRMIWTVTE